MSGGEGEHGSGDPDLHLVSDCGHGRCGPEAAQLVFRDIHVRGFWLHRWAKAAGPAALIAKLEQLAAADLQEQVIACYGLEAYPEALARAELTGQSGRIDPPLGDVLRLRRGSVDLPLEGAPDVLRALRWHDDPDGRAAADFGDGFMMVIDWAPDGSLSTRVIHQWGASDRAESAHYNDQSEMFSRREWRTIEISPAPR